MRERGTVLSIEGDTVCVDIEVQEGCASCASKEACKSGLYSIRARSGGVDGVAVGQTVEIDVDPGTRAVGVAWVVIVPLILLGCGYAAGMALFPLSGEAPGAIGGVAGLAFGLLVAAVVSRRGRLAALPRVVSVVGADVPLEYVEPDAPGSGVQYRP